MILTNDGELTNRLIHPRYKGEKEYLVSLDRPVSREVLTQLRRGVELADGRTAPAGITQLDRTLVKMVISEGRNRQIRRMFEVFEIGVERLVRVRIGPVVGKGLPTGKYRALDQQELRALWQAAGELR